MEVSFFVPFSSQVPNDNASPCAPPTYNHLVLKHLPLEDRKVVVRADYAFPFFFGGVGILANTLIHT